ncbi:ABC transporter ATP-binding protein [Kribbella catacumbae]|uniref:ABC transporter ATP-binding protein n=1 Tax=Kribbella catacumbae TaxID=460086 RepID=UPI0003689E81|nr:ABC transporter ATP-binding protein [Kribbella catacumbae]
MSVIEADGLRRSYRTSTGVLRRRTHEIEAVRGVSFTIDKGELFGLLGPNGAGKTTTIKMLTTLLLPTAGTGRVLGYDVATETARVRASIGYVFGGDRGLYERLNALDNLRYFADLYAVEPRIQRKRIAEVLDIVGLSGRERERVEGYSRGMRQRLHIARGLLHDPPVIFLDEPTIGVDPVGSRELRTTIAALSAAGKTILLTTHYMFEADALCDRVGIIAKGQLLAQGSPAELKARVADRTVVEIEAHAVTADAVEKLRRIPGVVAVTLDERDDGQLLRVQSASGLELTQTILARLGDARVGRIATREPTLEDAYVDVVTQGTRS